MINFPVIYYQKSIMCLIKFLYFNCSVLSIVFI